MQVGEELREASGQPHQLLVQDRLQIMARVTLLARRDGLRWSFPDNPAPAGATFRATDPGTDRACCGYRRTLKQANTESESSARAILGKIRACDDSKAGIASFGPSSVVFGGA